jgi:hypothetical protein
LAGRVLEAGEKPPSAILAFVAEQIDVRATTFDDYARRDETAARHADRLAQLAQADPEERNGFLVGAGPLADAFSLFDKAIGQKRERESAKRSESQSPLFTLVENERPTGRNTVF